ncbi:MAG TPA: TAXI family TRAP transporter solute-binding subunit [Chloroflexota bacterium]|nr:TAXI family TRAP transporter solute-binding subunit [Chloroflexota bacterium]
MQETWRTGPASGNTERSPVVQRSKMFLEVAAELVGTPGWTDRQVNIQFREQGASAWRVNLFASDAANSIDAVVAGEADIAICNPGAVLAMALHGLGPFAQPIPVRAIVVFPQLDRLGFAIAKRCGVSSIAEIKERRLPLKVSLRGQRDHSVHMIIDLVLSTYGFSLADIERWGGELRYTPGLGTAPGRLDAVPSGGVDIVIDEAFGGLAKGAIDLGLSLLPVDEPQLQQLEKLGLRRSRITTEEFPGLEHEHDAVDFSGWPVFCVESTPDDLVTHFCAALEKRKGRLPWYGTGPMDLKHMVSDAPDAPLPIPLHPAAERFWRQQGYL